MKGNSLPLIGLAAIAVAVLILFGGYLGLGSTIGSSVEPASVDCKADHVDVTIIKELAYNDDGAFGFTHGTRALRDCGPWSLVRDDQVDPVIVSATYDNIDISSRVGALNEKVGMAFEWHSGVDLPDMGSYIISQGGGDYGMVTVTLRFDVPQDGQEAPPAEEEEEKPQEEPEEGVTLEEEEASVETTIIDGVTYEEVVTDTPLDQIDEVVVDGEVMPVKLITDSTGRTRLVIDTEAKMLKDTEMLSIAMMVLVVFFVVVFILLGRR